MDKGYIVRWQSDKVYTKESVLPVCDKPYHMNNGFQQMWAKIKKMCIYAYNLACTFLLKYICLVFPFIVMVSITLKCI